MNLGFTGLMEWEVRVRNQGNLQESQWRFVSAHLIWQMESHTCCWYSVGSPTPFLIGQRHISGLLWLAGACSNPIGKELESHPLYPVHMENKRQQIKFCTFLGMRPQWRPNLWLEVEQQELFFFLNIYLAALGVSCSIWNFSNCGTPDLVPWTRIEPRHPALGARSLSDWTTGKSPEITS